MTLSTMTALPSPISRLTSSLPTMSREVGVDNRLTEDREPHAGSPTVDATESADPELREVFDQFVGETFYRQLISSMRKTVNKPAYFHGGRAEEVFQSQLDQVLTEEMSSADNSSLTDAMFGLFQLPPP